MSFFIFSDHLQWHNIKQDILAGLCRWPFPMEAGQTPRCSKIKLSASLGFSESRDFTLRSPWCLTWWSVLIHRTADRVCEGSQLIASCIAEVSESFTWEVLRHGGFWSKACSTVHFRWSVMMFDMSSIYCRNSWHWSVVPQQVVEFAGDLCSTFPLQGMARVFSA